MDTPTSTKSRVRRNKKDEQLRKTLMSDYSSVSSINLLADRKSEMANTARGANSARGSMIGRGSVVSKRMDRPSTAYSTYTPSSVKRSKGLKKTVAGLRPTKAMAIPCHISVQEAARKMGSVRGDAALVTLNGEVCGIITDSDITRRVVAEGKKAKVTPVSLVMTGNPLTMKPTDPAYEALKTMVDRHFRHMPVMRSKSSIVGVLDINKCIWDAIKRNEGKEELGHISGLGFTLREVISRNVHEAPCVYDKDSVTDAARVMKERRKTAVLVRGSHEKVVGILTTKDIMLRVVAARHTASNTTVARVMTPHPDTVPENMTVSEALKRMRTKKYLHLPVHSIDDGKADPNTVVGLVDALELCMVVLKPEEATDKENEGNGLRGVLEGLLNGDDSRSETESVAGFSVHPPSNPLALSSVCEDTRSKTAMSTHSQTVNRGTAASQTSEKDIDGKSVKSNKEVISKMESSIQDLEKSLSSGYQDAFGSLEEKIGDKVSKLATQVSDTVSKQVSELKEMVKELQEDSKKAESGVRRDGDAGGGNSEIHEAKSKAQLAEIKASTLESMTQIITKIEGLPLVIKTDLTDLINALDGNVKKLTQQVSEQEIKSSAQLSVISKNITNTAAAPLAIQQLKDILKQVRSEDESTAHSVSSSMRKIERLYSDTNTSLTKLSTMTAQIPEYVKTAVAHAGMGITMGSHNQRASQGYDVKDACSRMARDTIDIVRNKMSGMMDQYRINNKELSKDQVILQSSVNELRTALRDRLENDLNDKVQLRVETELYKVAGAAAMSGMVVGMLAVKLFAQ
mmetsp:Transcript_17934/g.28557  ORF Transcript_17934/g.28557 Transcript_17934/m.28557 type:complete len:799 (-) Transcript_17934:99-2495(-)